MFIAELSILASFLVFLFLFFRKIYPVIVKELDSHIKQVKDQIESAEESKREAEVALAEANVISTNVSKELEVYKKRSQDKIAKMEEENRIYLENLRKKSEATMRIQLQSELSRQKKILVNKLADVICEKLSEKLKYQSSKVSFEKEDLKKLL